MHHLIPEQCADVALGGQTVARLPAQDLEIGPLLQRSLDGAFNDVYQGDQLPSTYWTGWTLGDRQVAAVLTLESGLAIGVLGLIGA